MKEVEFKKALFECEVCKVTYGTPEKALKCEKKHSCKHLDLNWFFTPNTSIMIKQCIGCGKDVEYQNTNHLDIDQRARLYEFIKNLNEETAYVT